MELDKVFKDYFLEMTKGSSVVLWIDNFHVSEITKISDTGIAIGLSADYLSLRLYELNLAFPSPKDHRRFKLILTIDFFMGKDYFLNCISIFSK